MFSLYDEIIYFDYESINHGVTINRVVSKADLVGTWKWIGMAITEQFVKVDNFVCLHQFFKSN